MIFYRDNENHRTDRAVTGDYLYVCGAGTQSVGTRAGIRSDYTCLRPDGREDYHIISLNAGRCYVTHGDTTYLLQPGDFSLYYPGEAQKYTLYEKDENQYDWVHFKGTGAAALLATLGFSRGGVFHGAGSDAADAFFHLTEEFQVRRENFRVHSAAWLSVLLCRLSRTAEQEARGAGEWERRNTIFRIAAAMQRNPDAPHDMEQYAAALHVGRDRFERLFREVTGMPPCRYLQNVKMREARRLLRGSDLNISEIALALSYSDPLYFSRQFRKEVGISPRAYRAELEKSLKNPSDPPL